MDKTTKIILWSSVSVLAIAGFFLARNKYLDNKEEKGGGLTKDPNKESEAILKDTVGANETTTMTKIASDTLPFYIDRGNNRGGSEGLRVAQYQLMLNYAFNTNLDIDGKYGTFTKEATANVVPVTIFPCTKATALFGVSVCPITKSVWDYVLKAVLKKGGGSISGFNAYMKNSSEFANLARNKYKL